MARRRNVVEEPIVEDVAVVEEPEVQEPIRQFVHGERGESRFGTLENARASNWLNEGFRVVPLSDDE